MFRILFIFLSLCMLSAPVRAELYVVMGTNSPLVQLTLQQIKNLFLGRLISLPNGGTALPIDQPEGSPLREAFYQQVANLSAAQAKAHWARLYFTGRGNPPREGSDSKEIKLWLNRTPNTISYIEKSALDNSVRVLLTLP